MTSRVVGISAAVLLVAALLAWGAPADQLTNTALSQLKNKMSKTDFAAYSTNTQRKVASVNQAASAALLGLNDKVAKTAFAGFSTSTQLKIAAANQVASTALTQLDGKVDKSAFASYSASTQRKIAAVTIIPVFLNGTTVTLPSSGEVVYVKSDAAAKPLTLLPAAGQTVVDDSSYSLTLQNESVRLKLIGSNWSKY